MDVSNNRIPLSQLHTVMDAKKIHLGEQRRVLLPSLAQTLYTNTPYDLTSESLFDGKETKFQLLDKEGLPVDESRYAIADAHISFFQPGEYILTMENTAIHSKGAYLTGDFLDPDSSERSFKSTARSGYPHPEFEDFSSMDNRYKKYHPPAKVHTEVLLVTER